MSRKKVKNKKLYFKVFLSFTNFILNKGYISFVSTQLSYNTITFLTKLSWLLLREPASGSLI